MEEQTTPSQPDYQHGYTSGIEGLDKQMYEAYLSSKVSHEWVQERIAQKRTEQAQLREEKKEVLGRRKLAFDAHQEAQSALAEAAGRVQGLEDALGTVSEEQQRLREKREQNRTQYSLVAGLLFLVAGVAFVLGDLIISHEIVAYALNIRNTNEAWAFAIGLAMVSILLKPAYDRLIEGPYHDDPSPATHKRYGWFKIALAIFSVCTLLVLGWFRYEAYRTDKLKEAITKSVKNLQLNAIDPLTGAPINSPELTNKIEQALRESDQLNLMLVNSPWALLSFVLSGVLFAVAGAVSLGIGLPVLQRFWLRWLQIDPRLWRLGRRTKRLTRQYDAARGEMGKLLTRKHQLDYELSILQPLDWWTQKEEALIKEIDGLEEERKLALTDSRIQSYSDGYAHGEVARDIMTEEEFEEWRNSHLTISNLALRARSNPNDRAVPRSRSTGLRPHQAIRKAITDRLDEDNA